MTEPARPLVTVVATWLPTPAHPVMGSFVERDIAALASVADVRVVHLCRPNLLEGAARHDFIATPSGPVKVLRLPFNPARPWKWLGSLRQLKAALAGADVVHTMAISAVLPFVFMSPGAKWVHTEHWSKFAEEPVGANQYIFASAAMLFERVDTIAAVSPFLAQKLDSSLGHKAVVVPNIVDVPAPRERVAVGPTGRPNGTLRVVSVGGLIERKRPLLAVETVAELRKRGIDASLTWFGDGELRGPAEVRAKELSVPLEVTGFVPHAEVRQRYGDFDLFLGTTSFETFYLGAAEALASGRPVVCGGEGGHKLFVKPPHGIVVEGADPRDFADAVVEVLANCEGMTEAEIGADLRQEYSAAALAKAYLRVYRSS
ncbi:MAG: glycosyltransferase family 4 protein [Buchananella hordeovulneris]|nr:glycosyltransferase family 4 protein [Buchananella hordeovulneris]